MLFPVPRLSDIALDTLNKAAKPYGLSLTPAQAARLHAHEADALYRTGRICFGASILPQLVYAFCDSPYIQSSDWTDTLGALIATFYTLKHETGNRFSDEALILRMAQLFNGAAQGSPQLMLDSFFMEDTLNET